MNSHDIIQVSCAITIGQLQQGEKPIDIYKKLDKNIKFAAERLTKESGTAYEKDVSEIFIRHDSQNTIRDAVIMHLIYKLAKYENIRISNVDATDNSIRDEFHTLL